MLSKSIRACLIGWAVPFMAAAFMYPQIAAGQSFSFAPIDVPCSAFPSDAPCPTTTNGYALRTVTSGIGPGGDIVGNYTDASGKQHGFSLSGAIFSPSDVPGLLVLSSGQFTTIDVPAALVQSGATGSLTTLLRGIGPSGDIVGQFTAPYNPPLSTDLSNADKPYYCPVAGSPACIKGLLYSRGIFSPIMFPGHPGAILSTVNPDGSMYGCLHDYLAMADMFSAAWIRSGNKITPVSIAAGGGELSDPTQSFPCSMHGGAAPDGTAVGFYGDMTNACKTNHGYVLQGGILQTYDVPNSISTTIWDINPGHVMVGTYTDNSARPHQHGFLQLPDGSAPVTVDVPSTMPFNAVRTVIQSINPGGALVGQYTDTTGRTHGLLAVPATEI